MRTRTRLTTPPGREPDAAGIRAESETYVPGLSLPREPRVPGKHESWWITLGVVAVLVIGAVVSFRISTRGQEFDPALDVPSQLDEAGEVDDPVFEIPSDGLPGEGEELPGEEPADEPTDDEADTSGDIGL